MKKSEFLEKYTEVAVSDIMSGMDGNLSTLNIVISKLNKCYLGVKSSIKKDKLIDFLSAHDITYIESTFNNSNYPLANIGYSENENMWYGWSHRAIYGFTIGSEVKKGSWAFVPSNVNEQIENYINFWTDEDTSINLISIDEINKSFIVEHKYINAGMPSEFLQHIIPFNDTFGKGEWIAETIEDAKQMAIDFANGIN